MEEKIDNKKIRLVLTTLSVMMVVLMVSTVSAVPAVQYNQAKQLSTDTLTATIDKIINSKAYQRLYNIIHPRFIELYNETEQQRFNDRVVTNMSPYFEQYFGRGPLYPGLVEFLDTIGQAIMLFLGHGIIGTGVAITVCSVLALFASIAIGISEIPVIFITLATSASTALLALLDSFLYNFGIFGTIVVAIFLFPLMAILIILGTIGVDLFEIATVFIDTVSYM